MIYKEINDPYALWNWVKNSDSYKDNLTLEGAKNLQQYFEDYSEETGENISFDPIAWICDFSEYTDIAEAYKELCGDDERTTEEQQLDYLLDHTTVITFDGGVLVGAF